MHKFFVSSESIFDNMAVIVGDDVKHIYKVLRLESGTKVSINNCNGIEYVGEIVSVDKKEVKVKIIKEDKINRESPLKITLFQGLPKSSKMDLVVQKATELGINTITPLITERVIVKSELGEFRKTDRWRRIALEACKQCKRSLIPVINTPIEFEILLEQIKDIDLVIVPYENQEGYGIRNLIKELKEIKQEIKTIAIIVGPEGGFEESEILELNKRNCKIVTLGSRILRTETAGFVCASLVQYELGDLGGVI